LLDLVVSHKDVAESKTGLEQIQPTTKDNCIWHNWTLSREFYSDTF